MSKRKKKGGQDVPLQQVILATGIKSLFIKERRRLGERR